MPTFISKLGVWEPAPEKAVDVRTGEIYEGPDRAALDILKTEGTETLGMDARKDPENIMRARQLGMSVDEWLKMHEPPSKETLAVEEAKKTLVVKHADPKRKAPVNAATGGVTMHGGFGDIPKGS